jgi:isocitrate dehydrogenase kinase/phosphatase
MRVQLTGSRLANVAARAVYDAFETYRGAFRLLSRRARSRFEKRDWLGLRADAGERLDLYREAVDPTVMTLRELLGERIDDRLTWVGIKAVYSGLISVCDDWELAETFFNSITRRIFATVGVDQAIEFVASDFPPPSTMSPAAARERHPWDVASRLGSNGREQAICRVYERPASLESLFERILLDYRHQAPYADARGDAARIAEVVHDHLGGRAVDRAEILKTVFYRNKGAYIIGRLWSGGELSPVALALLHPVEGIVVDAVLLDENDLSIVFSFAHSYFLVDVDRPHELVDFLHSLMPLKRVAELYISLGYHKHGKTELYRDLLACLDLSRERFSVAPGERGMVMLVFTLPDYDLVVKVIKDRFAEPKRITRGEVMGKYWLVFRHDRAGRLVDAQEFEHLQLERSRFAPDLLEDLLRQAARTVMLEEDRVVIHHAYIERRVTPLDVFLRQADIEAARAAAIEFGNAIKDLAASNIFPGDFFLKNFGVTRHGRVVSYDYDELDLITNLRFDRMPQPTSDAEALAPEPWFHVPACDVFPEEFATYLRLPRGLDDVFRQHHGDLFEPTFWRETQARLRNGEVLDVFAYSAERRLRRCSEPLTASSL